LVMRDAAIRLLYLQPAPLFGGAERQAVEQASYLPRFGVEPTVVAGPGSAIIDWLRAEQVESIVASPHFPGRWLQQTGLGKLTIPFRIVRCGLDARAEWERLVVERGFDVILASLPFAWFTGSLVARRHDLPIAWRAGGAYINPAQVAGMWSATRFIRPDLLICNGLAVQATFSRVVPAPVAIVPNGVDTDVFHPGAGDPTRYRPAGARAVVGFAGRLATTKRPEDVIALAARLRHSHPGVRVLIAGEGSRRGEYERLSRDSGADNVTFLGFVADMPSFFAACDVIVLPSAEEGSSNVLLEAMACRKAIVATDIPALVEQVTHGETGLIYPLADVAAFGRAVSSLLDQPALRAALAERAFEHARSFTALRAAERLAGLLKQLVAEKTAKRRRSAPETARTPGAKHRASWGPPEPASSAVPYTPASDRPNSD
jgi:glycosyltransferase involved in cell wall biosynthesis